MKKDLPKDFQKDIPKDIGVSNDGYAPKAASV